MFCYVVLCYITLRYVMLCYAMLCYVMFLFGSISPKAHGPPLPKCHARIATVGKLSSTSVRRGGKAAPKEPNQSFRFLAIDGGELEDMELAWLTSVWSEQSDIVWFPKMHAI